jgi:putative peptidoglycan lipid II flippase
MSERVERNGSGGDTGSAADVDGVSGGGGTANGASGSGGNVKGGNGNGASRRAYRVVTSAAWVISLAIMSKGLGLMKDVVVAAQFGTSATMDAFFVAFSIPTIITLWFRSPIRAGFVPMFTDTVEQRGEAEAWRDGGVFLGNYFIMTLAIAVGAMVAAPFLVRTIAPGFGPDSRALAVTLVRIMLLNVALAPIAGTSRNFLHIYGNFALPAFTAPVTSLILIVTAVFFTPRFGIRALACGVVAGSLASVLIQSPILWKNREHFKLRVNFKDPMFWSVLRLALPLFIGMAGAKLDDVIDRVFASGLDAGSISGLAYALRLIDLPKEILIVAFWTVLFPFFSKLAARGEIAVLAERLNASMRMAFFFLFPISVGMALLGEPFVRVLFQRGAFDELSVSYTVRALLLYTPTIWALGLSSTMLSGFVAMKDTKTPTIAGFARLGVKIALIFLLIGPFRLAGIALATSVSHFFKLVLFLIVLPKPLREGRYLSMFRSFAGVVASTAIMGVILFRLGRWAATLALPDSLRVKIGVFLGLALVGALIYGWAAWFLARRELKEIWMGAASGVRDIVRRNRRR